MNTRNEECSLNIDMFRRYTIEPEYKETILDPEFCKIYFKCPLCGKKTLIAEAKHRSRETKRTLVGLSYNKETYQVTYHNFRICKECDESTKKGEFFAYLLWGVLGVCFYSIFAYIYFYTDDFCGTNYLLGPLNERGGWQFFFIFLSLTIFGSWLVMVLCVGVCSIYYKNDIFLGNKYDDAYLGNAIAPMEEKDN